MTTYQITRPIMTAAELRTHQTEQRGRDYAESDDGYSDCEAEERRGWRVVPNWGADGWNLGAWPYVMLYVRDTASCQSCGANLADGSGDGTNGHWSNCASPAGRFGLMQIAKGTGPRTASPARPTGTRRWTSCFCGTARDHGGHRLPKKTGRPWTPGS